MFKTSFIRIFLYASTITSWINAKPVFMRHPREGCIVLNSNNGLLVNDVLNANFVNDVLNVVN
jgi:hypothetical protein